MPGTSAKEESPLDIKLDWIRADIQRLTDIVEKNHLNLELRVRALENYRWWLAGGMMLMAFIAPIVAKKMFGI